MPGWKNPHFLSAWKRRILINFHCYTPCTKHQNYTIHSFEFESFEGGVCDSLWVSASWIFFLFVLPIGFQWNVEACLAWAVFCCTPGRFNLPIMIVASRFAVKEQQKSLKSSSVKLAARDVAPRTNLGGGKKSVKKQCRKEYCWRWTLL